MSIKKIAKEVGCSASTVSRILNDSEYKCRDASLREKIWKAAMAMNYTPNEAARNLKMGVKTEKKIFYIGVIMTRVEADKADPFFHELLNYIESEIHKNICILSNVWYMPVFSNDRKCREEDVASIIKGMTDTNEVVNGIIIIGKCNKDVLRQLKKKFKYIVSVNRNSTNYEVDEVICDGEKMASIAVEHLISLGHEKIAYVGDCQNEARYRGYQKTLIKNGIEILPEYQIQSGHTEKAGFEAMKKIGSISDWPTGIYCANDIIAVGLLKCLNRFYRSFPYSLSVVSSDDIRAAQHTVPMLTTVALPKEEMGIFAVKLLLSLMKGEHRSIVRLEVEGKLMVRESCHDINKKS